MTTEVVRLSINAWDQTKAAFRSVRSGLRSLESQAKIAGLAITAIGVATVNSSRKSIDANAKLADQLNITTEALAGLQHRAELTTRGGAEGLNKAMESLNKRLGEARNGTGEASRYLDVMGLKAEALTKIPDRKSVV